MCLQMSTPMLATNTTPEKQGFDDSAAHLKHFHALLTLRAQLHLCRVKASPAVSQLMVSVGQNSLVYPRP